MARLKIKDLEDCLERCWNSTPDGVEGIFSRFNSPSLRKPVIVEEIPGAPCQTAGYNFVTRQLMITQGFLEDVADDIVPGKFLLERAIKVILDHEVGHYVLFPRELSDHLYILSSVASHFKEQAEPLFRIYSDLANEGMLLASGLGDADILRVRECMARKEDESIEKLKAAMAGVKAGSKKPIGVNPVTSRLINSQRIILGAYQQKFEKSIVYKWPEYAPQEKELLDKLSKVQFVNLTPKEHVVNFFLFCDIMKEYHKSQPQYGFGIGKGSGSGGGDGSGMPLVKDIPKEVLERALSDLLMKYGPNAYRRCRKFLDKLDGKPEPSDSKQAGTESTGEITWNDDLIEMYKRWAFMHPVFIAPKLIVKDVEATTDQGRKEYEVGDSVAKTDIFASKGFVGLPGVSRVRIEVSELLPDKTMSVPDLLFGIDSSASMPHPNYIVGAMQCLAAAIIGRSYWRNNSHIGGWNFSGDLVYLPPQRDYDKFMHVMLGYWGGGTFPDMDAIRKLLATTDYGGKMRFMGPEDQVRMLSLEDQRKVMKKDLWVKTPSIKEKLKKLDNILVTDGYLANPEEVLEHLSELAVTTRNFVFITEKASYKKWETEVKMPNTSIYLAAEPEDLVRLSLGHCQDLRYTQCRSR